MACTACAAECLCAVIGQSPISVSGSGSGLDPYVVSIDICAYFNTLAVGTRQAISTDRIYAVQADGSCTMVQGGETPFVGIEGPFIDIIPGDNPAGPTGNGHSPTISVIVSNDGGNTVLAGSDGGLYVGSSGISTSGSPCMAVTGSGTPADPYVIGPVISPAVGNSISCNGDGLFVAASPPPALTPPGCGLVATGGFNGLRVNVSGTWDWPCAETNGSPIYCDSNGQLRGVPDHTCVTSPRNGSGENIGAVGVGFYKGAMNNVTIVNPSACRNMIWNSQYTFGAGTNGANFLAAWGYGLQVDASPGYVGTYETDAETYTSPAPPPTAFTRTSMNSDIGTIGPGGSVNITAGAFLNVKVGATNLPGTTLTATALVFGCTV